MKRTMGDSEREEEIMNIEKTNNVDKESKM